MLSNLQMAGLFGLTAMVRAVYETESHQNTASRPEPPALTIKEVRRIQQFLSYPPPAQEKALTYLQNLQRYLSQED